ncbi:MAG: amino acid adenylation domain-containing protein [Gammaproteobacteria bacterium]|nr:amino acid adenylation domain-containing protein [Gammaproteobacteria bacterium]
MSSELSLEQKRKLLREKLQRKAQQQKSYYPLSLGQQALWFLDKDAPGSASYHVGISYRICSPLDIDLFRDCFQTIVNRHAALRTTFCDGDEGVQQVVHGYTDAYFKNVEVIGVDDATLFEETSRAYKAPFDLEQFPLMRFHLLTRAEDEHVLVMNAHHIIVDGWSIWQILEEFFKLYIARSQGQEFVLPELSYSYQDYVRWQRSFLQSEEGDRLWSFWEKKLSGDLPVLNLPVDRPYPPVQNHEGKILLFDLEEHQYKKLAALAPKYGVTLFTLFLASYNALLHRITGQDDILVGSPSTGRDRPEFASIVGDFINTLVLRTDCSGNPKFVDFLSDVKSTYLHSLEHQEYPFTDMVRRLKPERAASRAPIVQNVFVWEQPQTEGEFGELAGVTDSSIRRQIGNLILAHYPLPQQEGQLDINFVVVAYGQQINTMALFYRTDIFDDATIVRVSECFKKLLLAIIDDPTQRIDDIDILPNDDRRMLVSDWNDTRNDYPRHLSPSALFEQQVSRTPHANALEFLDAKRSGDGQTEHLTYAQLNAKANQLAHWLIERGVIREQRVAICMDRSPWMVTSILAILKAGAAYLPLSPNYPDERLALILDHAEAKVVLTQPSLADRFSALSITTLVPEHSEKPLSLLSENNPDLPSDPEALAYVIYTSGSTGMPKGAMVEQRGMVNHLYAKIRDLDIRAQDKIAQNAPLTFDIATWQCLAALLVGGQVSLFSDEDAHDPERLLKAAVDRELTILQVVPAVLSTMLESLEQRQSDISPSQLKLRWLVPTGEALPPELARKWLAKFPEVPLLNAYGPTECSDDVSHYAIYEPPAPEVLNMPIGKPVQNTQLYVLNKQLQPNPIGIPGELHVAGDGVGRGYLGEPDKTDAAFIQNPFARNERENRMYKTGDWVRWLPDGNLEYLGRIDHQVKMRGFRIELQEVEAILQQHDDVVEATVILFERSETDKWLVAFITTAVTTAPGITVPDLTGAKEAEYSETESDPDLQKVDLQAQLKDYLKGKLPEYMVPSAFVPLEKIPLTPNGKVDRKRLYVLAENEIHSTNVEFIAPRNDVEQQIADIWAEVMGVEQISVQGNFFALGGHSLMVTRVISRISAQFGIEIPLQTLFLSPTVEDLAKAIQRLLLKDDDGERAIPMIVAVDRESTLPLSFAQERLWFLDQLNPENPFYNALAALRIRGNLNVDALRKSMKAVVERHEILRTRFPMQGENPVQRIEPAAHWNLELHVDGVPDSVTGDQERGAYIEMKIQEVARQPFDLQHDQPIRFRLFQVDETEAIFVVCLHHIVTDGWSSGILMDELSQLYRYHNRASDPIPPLTPLGIQFADYASWQRNWLSGVRLQSQRDYWKHTLQGAPQVFTMHTDHPRPAVHSYKGDAIPFKLSKDVTSRINTFCRQIDVTPFMFHLGVFSILLHHYSHQSDLIVSSPIANRQRTELEKLIGFFVNTIVLRIDLTGTVSRDEFFKQIRQTTIEAYEHQDLPFEQLVDMMNVSRDMSRNPLAQVSLAYQNMPLPDLELDELDVQVLEFEEHTVRFDLEFHLFEYQGEVNGRLMFYKDIYEKSTIARFLEHYTRLIDVMVNESDQPISQYSLLTKEERQRIVYEWNDTDQDYPDLCFHQLVESQVEKTPEQIAVRFELSSLNYRELNERANQLARYLRKRGIGKDKTVGVCMNRCLNLPVALLAVMKSEAAYVPLDANYPEARLQFMARDAGLDCVLSHDSLSDVVGDMDCDVLLLDRHQAEWDDLRTDNLPCTVNNDALVYLMYTSGSTGEPKGVCVRHRGLVNYLHWAIEYYEVREGTGSLVQSSISFDATITSLFAPLLVGNTVQLLPQEDELNALGNALALQSNHSLIKLTPAHLQLLKHQLPVERMAGSSRALVIGGEALNADHVESWRVNAPDTRLINEYGPTETMVGCCVYEIRSKDGFTNSVPIGRPIANTQLYILDENMTPVPEGILGELYISGHGVAKGYWNRPELTKECFIDNPFSTDPLAKMYRSGDLARYRSDGVIEYLGRRDMQVNHRGYRIELGEIENRLREHKLVRDAVAIQQDSKLAAFVVADGEVIVSDPGFSSQRPAQRPAQRLAQWEAVFDASYEDIPEQGDPRLNLAGWSSSLSGQNIAEIEMREWIDETVNRISGLQGEAVLEVGCGTGLLLSRLAPDRQYYGTDISQSSLKYIEHLKSQLPELQGVTTLQADASDFSQTPTAFFDLVILNSVIQYFPDTHYLQSVIEQAIDAMTVRGKVFLGDVRDFNLAKAFYCAVESTRSTETMNVLTLEQRVSNSSLKEEELMIAPNFFHELKRDHPQISHVQILLKRGEHNNELTRFRYDVVLHIDKNQSANEGENAEGENADTHKIRVANEWVANEDTHKIWGMNSGESNEDTQGVPVVDWVESGLDITLVEQKLSEGLSAPLVIQHIPNARLAQERSLHYWLEPSNSTANLTANSMETIPSQDRLKAVGTELEAVVDPEAFWQLQQRHSVKVDISPSDASMPFCFDVAILNSIDQKRWEKDLWVLGEKDLPQTDTLQTGPLANDPTRSRSHNELATDFKNYLQNYLPGFMVPAKIMVIPRIPLTPSAKVDQHALGHLLGRQGDSGDRSLTETLKPIEAQLVDIWCSVLGLEQVSVHDNFFDLGGDSILSIQLLSKIKKAGIALELKQLFQYQTIAELAQQIEFNAPAQTIEAEQNPIEGSIQLTPIYHEFLSWGLAHPSYYQQGLLIDIASEVSIEVVNLVANALWQHHDMLRQCWDVNEPDSKPTFLPTDHPIGDNLVESWALEEGEDESLLRSRIAEQLRRRINLGSGVLMQMALIERPGKEANHLIWVIHHVATDGVSWRILLEDFASSTIQASHRGSSNSITLPEKTTSFQYWSRRLNQFAFEMVMPQLLPMSCFQSRLPSDYSQLKPENLERNAVETSFSMNRQRSDAFLKQIPKTYRTGADEVLITALTRVLTDWTQASEIVLDLESHGRETLFDEVDLSRTVGWFTAQYPVVLSLQPEFDAASDITAVKEQLRKNRMPIHYGMAEFLQDAPVDYDDLGRAEIRFNYFGQMRQTNQHPILGVSRQHIGLDSHPDNKRSHVLDISAVVVDDCLEIYWRYPGQRYQAETIDKLMSSFKQVLDKLIDHCLDVGVGKYTPSDFPSAGLNSPQLRQIVESSGGDREIEAIYPLSPSQLGMLYGAISQKDSGLYLEQSIWHLSGELDVDHFRKAWNAIVSRHPTLRTRFVWDVLQQPIQVVVKQASMDIETHDWSHFRGLSSSSRSEPLEDFLQQDRVRGFDWSRPCLMRLSIINHGNDQHTFVWTHHHILMDDWGNKIILKDLLTCFEQQQRYGEINIEPAPSYQDYVTWLENQDLSSAKQYWLDYLRGFTRPTSPGQVSDGLPIRPDNLPEYDTLSWELGSERTSQLKALLRSKRLTWASLVQAVWGLLLAKFTDQNDVLFGFTVSGRSVPVANVESMLGLMINTLPVRVEVDPLGDFWKCVNEIQTRSREHQVHEHCSAGQIHQWSDVTPGEPLYHSLLAVDSYASEQLGENFQPFQSLGLSLDGADYVGAKTACALTMLVIPSNNLQFQMIFKTAHFTGQSVEQIASAFESVISKIAISGNGPVSIGEIGGVLSRDDMPTFIEESKLSDEAHIAPRDPLEWQLARIWKKVISPEALTVDVEEVGQQPNSDIPGIRDNFFTSGGQSLSAARLMIEVEQQWQLTLPISSLLENPTIEQLASVIRRGAENWSPLVTLQTQGEQSPVFCFPGIGGNVLSFYGLANAMGHDRPIYALQASGLDGESAPDSDMQSVTKRNIALIKGVQPQGPYYLLGYSFGGLVAYEMVKQLQAEGDEVAWLGLLDVNAPPQSAAFEEVRPEWTQEEWLTMLVSILENEIGLSEPITTERFRGLSDEQCYESIANLINTSELGKAVSFKHVKGMLQVFKANMQMPYLSDSKGVNCPTTLIRPTAATETALFLWFREKYAAAFAEIEKEETLGWSRLIDDLSVEWANGDHYTMLHSENAPTLAKQLNRSINESESINEPAGANGK